MIRRKDVGSPGEVLLDYVILSGTGQLGDVFSLFHRIGYVQAQQPGGSGVYGHRGVHFSNRNTCHQFAHVPQVCDGNPNFADLPLGQRRVRVISDLSWQIEGYGEPSLTFRQIAAVELIRSLRRGMT